MPSINARLYLSRDDLKERVVAAFSARNEIHGIHLFGREVRGMCDDYSDIDMVICSSDLAHTQAQVYGVLASISPVRATLPLYSGLNNYAEMVLLQDASPYQKIDLTICADISAKDWVGPFIAVYQDEGKCRPGPTSLVEVSIRKDVAYKLKDVLFSVPRFTKCLFRCDIDMYRRWNNISGLALVLLYEKHFGWVPETLAKSLAGYEAEQLEAALSPGEREQLVRIMPGDGRLDLASSYAASVNLIIELSRLKAEYFGIELDSSLIDYFRDFMDTEMVRYSARSSRRLQ